jgi:hypothetical protein
VMNSSLCRLDRILTFSIFFLCSTAVLLRSSCSLLVPPEARGSLWTVLCSHCP